MNRGRFHYEFWLICLIISLGFYKTVSIGFYRFRIIDLILILSSFYTVVLFVKERSDPKLVLLLYSYFIYIAVRVLIEFETFPGIQFLRTLFGTAATFLAPFIFFIVRESRVNRRIIIWLLIIACLVSLISQMGLLKRAEPSVWGLVHLGQLLHIQSRGPYDSMSLDYQERTRTVWRALSVGVTFALLLSKTKLWLKLIGVLGLFLQYGGGGGGRSAFLFILFTPIFLFLFQGSSLAHQRMGKILLGSTLGICFVLFYLWGPFGEKGVLDDPAQKTHFERASETLIILTKGWNAASEIGGFNQRTITYALYWRAITSNPSILFFGTGLSEGAAFKWTPLKSAHNTILDIWGLSGLIGLIFFLIFFGYVFSDLIKLLRAAETGGTVNQIIALSYATAVLYFFQFLLVQAVTLDRSFMIVFYLVAGLLKPATRLLQRSISPSKQISQ